MSFRLRVWKLMPSIILFITFVIITFFTIFYRVQYYHYYNLYIGMRICNTIKEVEYATLGNREISNYLYTDVISVLNQTTAKSLNRPKLVSAKISYKVINGYPNRLMIYIAWVESLPSIDGICVHLPSESFIVNLNNIQSGSDYGWVLFVHQQLFFETDTQWEKWLKTIDLLKMQTIYVSLVRNKKILNEKVELKYAPFPSKTQISSTRAN